MFLLGLFFIQPAHGAIKSEPVVPKGFVFDFSSMDALHEVGIKPVFKNLKSNPEPMFLAKGPMRVLPKPIPGKTPPSQVVTPEELGTFGISRGSGSSPQATKPPPQKMNFKYVAPKEGNAGNKRPPFPNSPIQLDNDIKVP